LSHREYKKSESGFSLLEVLVAMFVMLIIAGAIFALMRDSMKTSTAALELSDAQESVRTAQEYINRDLVNVGDGLNSINSIRVPVNFVTNFLTLNPVTDPSTPGFVNLALLTSDNNVLPNTPVLGTVPGLNVRSTPLLTDRISILQMERSEIFTPITLAAGAFNLNTGFVAVSPADIDRFAVGEIYFITSGAGGIFVTVTDRRAVGGANPFIVFATGDAFGLNSAAQLDFITASGALPVSLCRMKIIHYYVNDNGLLMRRVFGVRNAGFNESVIAEHAVSLQFRYFLNLHDAAGNVAQPEAQLTTSEQQVETRQVEVTLTMETPHTLQNGQRQQITTTTSTSVRNMQFRRSLQPTAGG
jgi:prepilin-type N-terminal cleavage/methylation domain-containing protein